MAKKRSKRVRKKQPENKITKASDIAKKLKHLQRSGNSPIVTHGTQHRSAIESEAGRGYISDEETELDQNITSSYIEKYHEEKFKNIESKIEATSIERIHKLEKSTASSLGSFKTEMLVWFLGIIIVIVLGLIGFHYVSLSDISEEMHKDFESTFQKINSKFINIEEDIKGMKQTKTKAKKP